MRSNLRFQPAPSARCASSFRAFTAAALALIALSAVRGQDYYFVGKTQQFIQTGATTVIPDPTGPFTFNVSTPKAGLTLTTPTGETFPLVFDVHDEDYAMQRSFATKAALDAAFPNGTYTIAGPGSPTVTVVLTGDMYPVIPQVTGGNWNAGGALLLTPATAATLNFNTFTSYATVGVAGHLYAEFGETDRQVFSKAISLFDAPATPQPFTSLSIPGSALPNNTAHDGNFSFDTFTVLDTTSVPGSVIIAGYSSSTIFAVTAVSSGTGGNPPVITRQPTSQTAALGSSVTFTVAVTAGTGPGQAAFFNWRHNGEYIPTDSNPKYSMAANGSLTVKNVTADDVGDYAVFVQNTGGVVASNIAVLTPLVPPVISAQPLTQNVVAGGNVTLTVAASGSGNTYQWRKDGAAIAGATASSLTLANVTAANAGSYTVVITNSAGSATSSAATLTLVSASAAGRLINLSILTVIGSGGESFTMGYVVGGAGTSGPKPLVIRAAGPSLSTLGVSGPLDDPKFELFAGSTKSGENDNWGGGNELANAMVGVGAFAFSGPTSRDAAALANITSSDNSVRVSAAGNGTGMVIAELYDATPAASYSVTTPRLVNVSVLKNVGTGLTAGFVIGGSTSKTVLVRAIGPTLGAAPFSVPGAIADPQLALFSGPNKIGENNDWGGTPALSAAFTQVGAFPLAANSKDAALLATLAPGNYTVQVSGTGPSGTALIEVYDVP